MNRFSSAFTMIELVFVIVVIGILSAIAIPKFATTRNDAITVRGRSTVAALRSALSTLRQKNILKGNFVDINGSALESEIDYGLGSDWSRSGDTFTFTMSSGTTCKFKIVNNKLQKQAGCGVSDMSDL